MRNYFLEKSKDSCLEETKGEVLGYGRNIFMGYLNKVKYILGIS